MLDGDFFPRLGEIEHVEDYGHSATVFATVDSADHFDQGFALMKRALRAVRADDGQFALLHEAVVNDRVMMPAGDGPNGEVHADHLEFGSPGGEVRQPRTIPTLRLLRIL